MIKQHLCQFFAVTALTAGMVLAQAPASGTQPAPEKAPFAHPMFGHEQMMKNLDLTPAQKQQADTIFGNAREKARPIRQEIQQNREALHAAMKANNTAQIERLSTQQGNLMGKALAIRTTMTQPGFPFGSGTRTSYFADGKGLVKLVFQHGDKSTSTVELLK